MFEVSPSRSTRDFSCGRARAPSCLLAPSPSRTSRGPKAYRRLGQLADVARSHQGAQEAMDRGQRQVRGRGQLAEGDIAARVSDQFQQFEDALHGLHASSGFLSHVTVSCPHRERNCPNCPNGNRQEECTAEGQDALAVENLAAAAAGGGPDRRHCPAGTPRRCPRYPLLTAADALAVISRVRDATGAGTSGSSPIFTIWQPTGTTSPPSSTTMPKTSATSRSLTIPGAGHQEPAGSRWTNGSTAAAGTATRAPSAWNTGHRQRPPSPSPQALDGTPCGPAEYRTGHGSCSHRPGNAVRFPRSKEPP